MGTSDTRLYSAVAHRASRVVIRHYSSSFGAASLLFSRRVRLRVAAVYALVRVADEIADHPDPAITADDRRRMLDALQVDLCSALRTGHSPNLVVQAFAETARACGIGPELTDPFFDSMRTDLVARTHDQESYRRYVYGSAEVVGLMCLRVFLADVPTSSYAPRLETMETGARRLGSAFQEVNFLRDLAEDTEVLGRCYFPGVEPERFSEADRDEVLDRVDRDLATAQRAIVLLPPESRRAVQAAHDVFAELSRRLRSTPAERIRRERVRVPAPVKLRLVAGAVGGART